MLTYEEYNTAINELSNTLNVINERVRTFVPAKEQRNQDMASHIREVICMMEEVKILFEMARDAKLEPEWIISTELYPFISRLGVPMKLLYLTRAIQDFSFFISSALQKVYSYYTDVPVKEKVIPPPSMCKVCHLQVRANDDEYCHLHTFKSFKFPRKVYNDA